MKQDLLSFKDWTAEQLWQLLNLAKTIKKNPTGFRKALDGLSIVALFEKPSLRTRVSFDIGINKLGGHLVYLDSQSNKLVGREEVQDMGATRGRQMVHWQCTRVLSMPQIVYHKNKK